MGNSVPTIVGKKIVDVRPMTKAELSAEGWDDSYGGGMPVAVVLSDGSTLYPSQDPEGNGPGALFGKDTKGGSFIVFAGE